jgi:hypothetical protein
MALSSGEGDDKVRELDRARYQKEVVSLQKRLADALSNPAGIDEQAVWEAYAGTEKLIAVLKYRLDYETPGVFTRLPDASDTAALIQEATALLSSAGDELSGRKMVEAVETLRKARNNLRSYLTERSKSATKASNQVRGDRPT